MKKKEKIIKPNLNLHNRVGIIVLSLLIVGFLVIGWILGFAIYRSSMDNLIMIINSLIKDKGFNIDFTFQLVTIIVVSLIVMMLFITTLPFIIFSKQTVIIFVSTVMTILMCFIIDFGTLAFYLFCGKEAINEYACSCNNINSWVLFVPWAIVIVLAIILSGYGFWLIVKYLMKKEKLDITDKIEETVTAEETLLGNNATNIENTEIVPEVIKENNENNQALSENEYQSLSTTEIPVTIDEEEEYNKPIVETTTVPPPSMSSDKIKKADNISPANRRVGINIVITNNSIAPPPPPSYSEPSVTSRPVHVVANQLQEDIPLPTLNMNEIIWTKEQIAEVWEKGAIVPNVNPHLYRKDYAGALMFKNSFLNSSKTNDDIKSYNWTIVCQRPLSQGGTLDISNLWPLNNTNAVVKGDNYPRWETKVTYDGKQNIVKKKIWKDK